MQPPDDVRYVKALRLLPGDPRGWAASTWIYVALGDVHVRRGVELGDHDRAADELMRAYRGGEPDVFAEDAPTYLAFLRTRADLDHGGFSKPSGARVPR
ncbi:hypothetical protein ACH47Z_17070 [Streptomyces sp. NPDC020192]|uniref:hypothetical protein n=1 Tax=Streptomyces sp. NPDC020192 TaxID=3365066 RepID=UPI0037A3E594